MRGRRGIEVKLIVNDDDTLTVSCEGAVKLMVIAIGDGPLPQLLSMLLLLSSKEQVLMLDVQDDAVRADSSDTTAAFFCFYRKIETIVS